MYICTLAMTQVFSISTTVKGTQTKYFKKYHLTASSLPAFLSTLVHNITYMAIYVHYVQYSKKVQYVHIYICKDVHIVTSMYQLL